MTKTETGEHLRFSDQLSDWKYLGGTLCSDEISKAAHSKKKKNGNFRRSHSAKLKAVDIKYSSIKEVLCISKEKIERMYQKYNELEKMKETRSGLLI